jgi:flagellar basal-body rod modification protein FlgD
MGGRAEQKARRINGMASGPMGVERNSAPAWPAEEKPAKPAGDALVGKDDFLKLLVAQIKNQNPLNPADGIQFLSQLAQFSQLEQLLYIRQALEKLVGADGAPGNGAEQGGAQGL